MTQAMRVALWVPTTVPPDIGDSVVTTNPQDANKALPTKFLLGGSGGGGGIGEAPSDGQQYARQNAGWTVVVSAAIGTDAPQDGSPYARQDGNWVSLAVMDAGQF
jgi:hypothetical protein